MKNRRAAKGELSGRRPLPRFSRPCVERMIEITRAIYSGERVNATTLAAKFETSTKTINRDMDFLRERVCLPIEYDASEFRYVISDHWEMPAWLRQLAGIVKRRHQV